MAVRQRNGCKYQWQAVIKIKGYAHVYRTFSSKKDAVKFDKETEAAMRRGDYLELNESGCTTIETLAQTYIELVSPTKKNEVEDVRLMKVVIAKFGKYYLSNVKQLMIKNWLDDLQAKGLAGSTINHHLSALSSLIETAIKEWGYALPANPAKLVKRKPAGKARDRRLTDGEEELILAECKLSRNQWLYPAVLLSVFTAMRQGELFKLQWEDVNLESQVAMLYDTKNGEDRAVPLSSHAVRTFKEIPGKHQGKVFKCSQHGVASSMRNAIERAKVKYLKDCETKGIPPVEGFLENIRLHDLRHEATSRFFELGGLNMMEVASITGHKTLSQLKRYTHLKASTLAQKLG
jgi:integrase